MRPTYFAHILTIVTILMAFGAICSFHAVLASWMNGTGKSALELAGFLLMVAAAFVLKVRFIGSRPKNDYRNSALKQLVKDMQVAYPALNKLRTTLALFTTIALFGIASAALWLCLWFGGLTASFTLSEFGNFELGERIFKMTPAPSKGHCSLCSSYSGASNDSDLKNAVTSTYGSKSPQTAYLYYILGLKHSDCSDFKGAETLLNDSNSFAGSQLVSNRASLLSEMAYCQAKLGKKTEATRSMIQAFESLSQHTIKQYVVDVDLARLGFVACRYGNDEQLDLVLSLEKTQKQVDLYNSVITPNYIDLLIFLLLATVASLFMSNICERKILECFSKRCKRDIASTANLCDLVRLYSALIDLEMYNGNLATAAHYSNLLLSNLD
jgi:hypothetical protein